MADRSTLERLGRELADKGKLVEAGWVALRLGCGLLDAPAAQLRDMRFAYMSGAQHLFVSMTGATMLDDDAEVTEADIHRMDLLYQELNDFYNEQVLRDAKPAGKPS